MMNEHIFEYLDYYVALPHPPEYAVLVNGAWGVGKTFAIKHYLKRLSMDSKKTVYISLYGKKTIADIGVELIAGAYSKLNNKFSKAGIRICADAIKNRIRLDDGEKLLEFWTKGNVDLFVFDDLERVAMPISEVLGYINGFVEHNGARVLIVCNEDELAAKKDKSLECYRRIKEKIVGHTFEFQVDGRGAYDVFMGQVVDRDAKEFLTEHKDDAIAVFQQSGTKNIRLLRHAVSYWSRLYGCLEEPIRDNTEGIRATFLLFMALSLEVRAGRLDRKDLSDRVWGSAIFNMGGEKGDKSPPPLAEAQERYPQVDLSDSVMTDDLLQQMLFDGRYDAAQLSESLSRSKYFQEPGEEPAWQIVWGGIERSVDEFNAAVEIMEEQFVDRRFVDSGEILHVFGLRLWCAHIGHLEFGEDEISSQCRTYIDELFSDGKLLEGYDKNVFQDSLGAAYGLAFWMADTPHFKELFAYYGRKCEDALKGEPDYAHASSHVSRPRSGDLGPPARVPP